jgi:hypothetical protein
LAEFFGSLAFRLLAVPLATAGLGCFIRYHAAKLQQRQVKGEIFIVWPELLIAGLFNVFVLILDLLGGNAEKADLLGPFATCLVLLLSLWVVSFVAALPRQGSRQVIWSYIFPHLMAFAGLEFSLIVASSSAERIGG